MALYLHLGSAGAGKTTGMQNRILEEATADKLRSFLIVVPEQFTLQTQRDVIEKSPSQGMMNIDVLSFARMSHRVFEELGVDMLPVLEDTGKGMIVKKTALENKERLSIYRNKVTNQGFIEEMKSLIAEFYQYGIGADEIEKMMRLSESRKQLTSKIQDISVLYSAFADFIDGRFCMNEEITDRLCEVAGQSKLLEGSVVAFDGFTGFTPSQYNCLRSLMKISKDIHVALTINQAEAEKVPDTQSLFYLSMKTIMKLERLADEEGINVIRRYYSGEEGRFKDNATLGHLERHIFRYPYTQTSNDGSIQLLSCETKEQEILFLVAKIRELIFESGYRYQDIAVVTGDLDAYAGSVSRELYKANIPIFVDQKKTIKSTSAVEFIEAALEIVRSDFSYDSVFRFLKTGYTKLNEDKMSLLENYVIQNGIKGYSRWKKEWKLNARNRDVSEKLIDEINEVRSQFVEIVCELVELEKKEPNVRERITALYNLLDKCEVEEALFIKSSKLSESADSKDRISGREKSQLFRSIIDVFDRIDGLLSQDKMPLKEFEEILDTGFNEAKLRNIPGGADSVVLGDIERTRLNNKKVVFFIGVNDSVIPKPGKSGGILTDYDRSLFEDNDIELSPTKKENAYLSEFYLYLALTRPSERLFMSFPKMCSNTEEGRPAYIIGRLQKLYTNLKVVDYSDLEVNTYLLLGADKGLTAVTEAIRNENFRSKIDSERVILKLFEKENAQLYSLLKSASSRRDVKNRLEKNTAEWLYGECIKGSITRLQSFAECAFLHYLKYGLGIKPREEYKLSGLEIGNIYHTALEKYGVLVNEQKKSWRDVKEQERTALEMKAVELAVEEYADLVESSKRNEYFKERLMRVLSRSVDVITEQIEAGSFEVKFLERSFEHSNKFLSMRGKIDRIDVAEKNGKTYVRVIDYKSGKQNFDLNMLYYGLQLQLIVYLRECGIQSESAGMYYYKIDDPVVELNDIKTSSEEIEKLRRKNFVLDGISVSDPEVLGLLDNNLAKDGQLEDGGSSSVFGIKIKKAKPLPKSKKLEDMADDEKPDYSPRLDSYSEKKVLSAEKLDYLKEYAAFKTTEMTNQIKNGIADINPYIYNNKKPCEYCDYNGVCGFDVRQGDEYRVLDKKAAETKLWKAMDNNREEI